MDQKIEFRQTRDFGQIITDTFVFVKQNFKPLLKSVIYICGFFFVAYAITSVFNTLRMQEIVKDGTITKSPFRVYSSWEFGLNMIFSVVFYSSLFITVFSYISLYLEKLNQAPNVEEVWAYFKHFFLRLLIASFLMSCLTMVGFIFCLVPAIYLWPVTLLIVASMVFENSTLGYAFSRGFSLIKNNWWSTFGAIGIVTLIVVGLVLLITLPATILSTASLLLNKTTLSFSILNAALGSIAAVFMVLPCVAISLAYFSLVEQKEGTGLQDKINQIGQNNLDLDLPEEQY